MKGSVTLIGAGCGDFSLITLRGKKALERCDTVIYDALIDKRLLMFCPPKAEKICVGKRAGHDSTSQQEINQILIEKALAGKTVARLKGGDPFVFGRGGEEIIALKEACISFHVIPGITSASAVPELAGIPVTHRKTARSFHVITGHTAEDMLPENFSAYAKCGGTLIFLMGLGNIEKITQQLIANGMDEHTPAAVISNGASADQKVLRAKLGNISIKANEKELTPPAVIVVGETANFDFSESEKLPLYGMTAALTATPALSAKLADMFSDLGAYAYRAADFDTRELFNKETEQAFSTLEKYTAIAFSSPNGVEMFVKKLKDNRIDVRNLCNIKFAVIGKSTARRLAEYGIYADMIPEEFTAAALGSLLAKNLGTEDRLLILRSKDGSPELIKPLREAGICYDDVNIYEPVYGGGSEVSADIAVFTSAGGVRNFFERGGMLHEKVMVAAIGKLAAAELEKYGVNKVIIPRESTALGIIEKIVEVVKCKDSEDSDQVIS